MVYHQFARSFLQLTSPSNAARPLMAPRFNFTVRRVLSATVWLYRWRCGWLLGHRFLLLIHKGRRTGLLRYTVLEVMEYRKANCEVVVMSAWGRDAGWFRNIEASPRAEIIIGSEHVTTIPRILDVDEAASVIAGYERRNRIMAPVIRIVLSRLLGWRYDSSEDARRNAAAQLPLIAFRPLN